MEYLDEPIIEALNNYKTATTGDIYSGVYIKERKYEFSSQELFNGKFCVYLPITFVDMPAEIAKIKYPSEQRPQIIKTNKSGCINFTFSLLDIVTEKDKIASVKTTIRNVIKKVQPSNVFYEDVTEPLGNSYISWFDYKSYAVDNQIYNLVYTTLVDNRVLHGVFNCINEEGQLWKPIALQVIRSIRECSEGEEI